ncbi:dihydrofolate reductase family protein [bacterium]|nr:dihydrofolate reductase family protein [bacterium]
MRTTVYIGTSLDGYIAREDGNIDWLEQFANDEAFITYGEFISRIDVFLIGRGTFEKALTFSPWPYTKPLFVLSSSIKEVSDAIKDKVTLLSMQPRDVLRHLSERGFKNVYVDGGKVIQSFLREDLIDDLIVSKVPVLIGRGIPLFGHLDSDLLFKHIRTETCSNGLVRSYYLRKRN